MNSDHNPNRSRFDRIAAEWDDSPTRTALATAVAGSIRDAVPLNGQWKALEYGCGTGLVTALLAPNLGSVLATDLSPGMLGVLRDKLNRGGLRNVDTRTLDLTSDPVPVERFDLVFSSMTLHHIEDIDRLLGAIRTLLVPGGWLAIADLDSEDGSFHGPDVPGIAHHGFERQALAKKVAGAGFESPAFRTAHEIVKQDGAGRERRYSVFLMSARRTG
jgi:Methylase involved in ubiquinone/menaquinone biosynthesis